MREILFKAKIKIGENYQQKNSGYMDIMCEVLMCMKNLYI